MNLFCNPFSIYLLLNEYETITVVINSCKTLITFKDDCHDQCVFNYLFLCDENKNIKRANL